jgi:hypothetical protein
MSKAEWSEFPYAKELAIPAMELPVSYALSFGWGNFQVTDRAHEAYGLTALTGEIVHGGEQATNIQPGTKPLSVDIWLTTPQEVPFEQTGPPAVGS